MTAPAAEPAFEVPVPPTPATIERQWLDLDYVHARVLNSMARTFHGGDAFPIWYASYGPGSLALILGSRAGFSESTVWYEPCIDDPDAFAPPLRADLDGIWMRRHVAMAEKAVADRDRYGYAASIPDLIENIDILASLRGTEATLADLVERPGFCKARIAEINEAFFAVFDRLRAIVRDGEDGNCWCAFAVWGPGRTAKVQCDFACMISERMFREFVVPALADQCARLDHSLFHLDGAEAAHHLPALLGIPALDAIEFTPRAGMPGGGDRSWYPLYRRILAGGKRLQAIGVAASEVVPLLEAVGTDGVCILAHAADEREARETVKAAERFR